MLRSLFPFVQIYCASISLVTYDFVQTLIRYACKKLMLSLFPFYFIDYINSIRFDSIRFHFSHRLRIHTSFVCTHFDLHYNALRVHAHTQVSIPNTTCLSLRERNNQRDQTFLLCVAEIRCIVLVGVG